MQYSEQFEKIKDRKMQREIGYIDVFMVLTNGDIRFYNSASEAYHVAQQTGGMPIAGMLHDYDLYRITQPRLLSRKAYERRHAKQKQTQ